MPGPKSGGYLALPRRKGSIRVGWAIATASPLTSDRRHPSSDTIGRNVLQRDVFADIAGLLPKTRMSWVYLFASGLVLWGACGALIAIGRRLWTLDTTLRVHLAAAPIISFIVSAIHRMIAPDFDVLLRATILTGLVVMLDAIVVAPLFERSYAMFRSLIGTWLPFAAIFLASVAAGLKVPG